MSKISYYLFSHKALYTFVKEVLAIVNEYVTDDVALTSFVTKVNQQFQDFDLALSRDYIDPFTTKVSDADRERDLRFVGLKSYLEACCFRKESGWKEAAQQIQSVIERYGKDLYRLPLPEESAALQNLFTDLGKEPLKSACNTLLANPWLDELKEAQSAFEALVKERHKQELSNDKTLLETRRPLVKATRNLLKMVELQYQVEATDTRKAMNNELNNLINSSMASARISRSLSDKAHQEN